MSLELAFKRNFVILLAGYQHAKSILFSILFQAGKSETKQRKRERERENSDLTKSVNLAINEKLILLLQNNKQ